MKFIKKMHGFLLVLLCFSSISGITLTYAHFLPHKINSPSNEEIISYTTVVDLQIDVNDNTPLEEETFINITKELDSVVSNPIIDESVITNTKEVELVVTTPIKNKPLIPNPEPNLVESPPEEDEILISTSKGIDPSLSSTTESIIVTPQIIDKNITITIDLGVKIGLGNEKYMTCPSPDWNFTISSDACVEYDTDSEQILEDLDAIVKNLVIEWIQNVEKKGVRKQLELERRGTYNYNIKIL